jgi:hypothetical protein
MPPDKKDTPAFAEAVSMTNEELAARLRDVENQLATTRAGIPLTLIPEHAAGPGMEVRETWSQAEQEAAAAMVAEPVEFKSEQFKRDKL